MQVESFGSSRSDCGHMTGQAVPNQAWELAFFLSGHEDLAAQISARAVNRLRVAAAAQDKRRYYQPSLRVSQTDATRSKIILSETDLLQYLIYRESEFLLDALCQGRTNALPQSRDLTEELLIHYVKHLVMLTVSRNSFHVMIGISRVLHNYSTTEAILLYHLVTQNQERAKDESYWRARKGQLIRALKTRFGSVLTVVRGRSGEERIQAQADTTKYQTLVDDCLRRFTPWSTSCLVSENFTPQCNSAPTQMFDSHDDNARNQIKIARMHALIHPACFARLTSTLGLAAPHTQLEIPQFDLSALST